MFGKLNFIQKLWGITEASTRDFSSLSLSSWRKSSRATRLLQNNFFVSTPVPVVSREPPLTCHFSDFPTAHPVPFNPFKASFYLRRPAICACILQTKLGRRFVCYQDFAAGNLERTAAGAVADCVYEIEALALSSCIHL